MTYGDFDLLDVLDAEDLIPRPRATMQRYLVELAAIARFAGLDVIEVEGWQYRARSSGGYENNRPWCYMWHHTASYTSPDNDVDYIISCEDAPLANLYLDRVGTVWVCAAGATNTNGQGGPFAVSRGTVPADSMNTHAVSCEMANDGVGERWSVSQINAAFTLSIAVCRFYGLDAGDICTHTAWTTRKIDPATAHAVEGPWRPSSINSSGSWSLDDLRAEHARRWSEPASLLPEEDDMNAATLWRPEGYLNVFLVGAGSTVNVSPAVAESLTERGVPTIVEAHPQMLETCLFQTGLTPDDLVPGG